MGTGIVELVLDTAKLAGAIVCMAHSLAYHQAVLIRLLHAIVILSHVTQSF